MKKFTHGAFRIKTDIAYVGLGLINCVLIFVAFILVYFFRRLLYDIFLLPQNIVSSNNILASPPPTKPISGPCQWTATSLQTS